MPPVIAALGATAFTAFGVAVTYGTLAQTAIVVAGIARSRQQAKRAQRAYQASLQDRTTPVRQSDAARTIVYGKTRVSGPIIYHKTHGTKREMVSHVIAIAGHEITAVDEVWFNDKSIAPWTSGYVTSGSPYLISAPEPLTQTATGTGSTQTITLDLSGATLVAVDSVAYYTGDIVESQTGEQVVREAVTRTLELTTDYTVAGNVVTILSGAAAAASGKIVTVTYRVERGTAYAAVWPFLGIAAGERDTLLEGYSGGEWTSAAIGRNVARLHVLTAWNETVYATGFPNVSAIVRGKKVYDPRLDSTNGGSGSHRADTASTWAYSANPALCAADYLRDALGFGCASSEIDWDSVRAAANVCDESVTIAGGGTQARYVCAGELSTETERKANLEAILDSMVGIAVYSGGRWSLRAGAYTTPTLDLDEGDLAGGDVLIQARSNRRDLYNAVRGRYRDPLQLYQVTDFPPYASSTYASEDGGEVIYREIDLEMVDDAIRAQRIAKLILFRARQAMTVQATFKLGAYALQPGDTCRLTIGRYGWSQKVFRVVRREFESLASVRLTLQEDASAIYAWNFNEALTPDPAPNTNLADPRYVAVPAGVTFRSDSTTYITRADGTYVPYVEVAWQVPAPDDVHIEVFWKRATETEYRRVVAPIGVPYAWLEGVTRNDVLNIYLYAVNQIGARSATVWRPTYTVQAVAQPITGIAAVNWLDNSTFVNGTEPWLLGSGPNANVSANHLTVANLAPPFVLAGTPAGKGSGLFIYEAGDRPSNGVPDVWVGHAGRLVPVIAGELIEGSMYLCTHRCTVDLRIAFYSSSGAYINEVPLMQPEALNDGSTLQTLADYRRRGGIVTVPTGAARAMLFVRKYGRNAGNVADGSYVFATYAMLGPAVNGQTDLSPFAPGSLVTVGTGDLGTNAVSLLLVDERSASATITPGASTLFTEGLPQITLPSDIDIPDGAPLRIEASVSVTFTQTASIPGTFDLKDLTAALALSDSATPGGGPNAIALFDHKFTAAPDLLNRPLLGSGVIQYTTTHRRGQARTFALQMSLYTLVNGSANITSWTVVRNAGCRMIVEAYKTSA